MFSALKIIIFEIFTTLRFVFDQVFVFDAIYGWHFVSNGHFNVFTL